MSAILVLSLVCIGLFLYQVFFHYGGDEFDRDGNVTKTRSKKSRR